MRRRKTRSRLRPAAGVAVVAALFATSVVDVAAQSLADALRARLDPAGGSRIVVADAPLLHPSVVRRFYQGRGHEPAWLPLDGHQSPARELLDLLSRAQEDGLHHRDYRSDEIGRLLERIETAPERAGPPPESRFQRDADLELLLSDAFVSISKHLYEGAVDPRTLDGEWSSERETLDAAAVLSAALSGRAVHATLETVRPAHPQYVGLRVALAALRTAAANGGWGRVRGGEALEWGVRDSRVGALRERLRQSGDLPPGPSPVVDADFFDSFVEEGVKRFQRRHGLEADGVVGTRTLEALNVPAAWRVTQVEANLERWRWLPADLGDRHVLVNVPGFSVAVREPAGVVSRHRAIVGRTTRSTPTFSSRIESLVLAPYWNVPAHLAIQDILPRIRRSSTYLASQGMKVLDARTGAPVAPSSIDWGSLSDSELVERYRLRQDPGPRNALGQVKFVFPNRYAVLLHDTPDRELFERGSRDFSSGCVRVERPLEIVNWLLEGDSEWTPERTRRTIAAGKETTVPLREPVPVHLLYLTAFVDEDGWLSFAPDLYGRDAALARALSGGPVLGAGGLPGRPEPGMAGFSGAPASTAGPTEPGQTECSASP